MAERKVLILNPVSGNAKHAKLVREQADKNDFEVWETEGEDHAVELASKAVHEDYDFVAACGGDGTVNEVLYGIYKADGLEETALGIVPAGTGNNFAGNVGIHDIRHAFKVMEDGERRRIDIGEASDGIERPFVNSCVAGLTADASKESDSESKSKMGVMAYVLSTLRSMEDFDSVRMHVDIGDDVWEGEAMIVMVGNGRKLPSRGNTQANMEDGLLDVTIIEDKSAINIAREAAIKNILGGETDGIYHFKTSSLDLKVLDDELWFSLDGEMVKSDRMRVQTMPSSLELPVGKIYRPNPEMNTVSRMRKVLSRMLSDAV